MNRRRACRYAWY